MIVKRIFFSTNKRNIHYTNHKKKYQIGNSLIYNNSSTNKISNSKDYSNI